MEKAAQGTTGAYTVEVGGNEAGQRLDNFLINRLKGAPRSLVYRIVRRGEVRVNKGRIRPDYRLVAGDQVRIPPLRLAEREAPVRPGDRVLALIEASILHEDERVLVLNKPSGIAVHGGSGLDWGVIEALRALRPGQSLELVHRLDRETSGCLMVAKRRSALRTLHELLRGGGVEKRYHALLRGVWQGGERRVVAPLLKNTLRSGERMVRVDEAGKPAESRIRSLQSLQGATLAEIRLVTGRTHQARVHCAHIGMPIAGDAKYGDEAFNAQLREQGLNRLFLHARSLRLRWPEGGELAVEAPLDKALLAVVRRLGGQP